MKWIYLTDLLKDAEELDENLTKLEVARDVMFR